MSVTLVSSGRQGRWRLGAVHGADLAPQFIEIEAALLADKDLRSASSSAGSTITPGWGKSSFTIAASVGQFDCFAPPAVIMPAPSPLPVPAITV